jgi:hypothetical protein
LGGDRYSKPTIPYRTDIGKILAIWGDDIQYKPESGDSPKLALLREDWHCKRDSKIDERASLSQSK